MTWFTELKKSIPGEVMTGVILMILIIGLFGYLRLYNLPSSLFFQNDSGRDYLELMEWQETGKPPLLGPQMSNISFNQSAWYFYFFYPFFVLSNHSYFTTNLTLIAMYVVAFAIGFWSFRHQPNRLQILAFLGLLISVHPLVVIQHRYIWNPSFVPLFLSIAFFAFLQFQKKNTWFSAGLFGFGNAFAIGMSFSAIPATLAFVAISLFLIGRKSWRLAVTTIGALLFVFLPLVGFEIKYGFQITSRTVGRGLLDLGGTQMSLTTKLWQFWSMHIPGVSGWSTMIFLLGLAIVIGSYWLYQSKAWQQPQWFTHPATVALSLFGLTSLLVITAPVLMESHYMFGPLTFFLIFIAALPRQVTVLLTVMAVFFWLRPTQLDAYFHSAPWTVAEADVCFSQVCTEYTEPLFVSVTAGYHQYHVGPEFRYMLKKNGCQVKAIEREPTAASLMAVVVDDSAYTHGQTAYDELTLFGPADEIDTYRCNDRLQLHFLKKKFKVD